MLSEAYRLSRFEPKEIQNAEKIYKSLSPIRARTLLYQSIIRDNKPESKFRKIIALIKMSKLDNLLPKISYLLVDLMDYKKFIRNHEDSLLISQMFQSKNKYLEARDVLNTNYKSPESDYRYLAIDISEFVKNNIIDNYSLEKQLEKFEDKSSKISFFKKTSYDLNL